MEENQNMSMEATDGEDLFLDAEDVLKDDGGNQTAETSEVEAEPALEEGTEPTEDAPETAEEPAEEMFDLKYMKETKQVTRQEVVELAQKGMDYDRAVQQRDSLRNSLQEQLSWRAQNEDVLNVLGDMAKQSGVELAAFVENLQENMLIKQGGLSRDAARERIEKEKLQRKLNAKEQLDLKNKQDTMQQTRAQKEIAAFAAKYPDVDVKSIPREVFQRAVTGETSLVGAYAEHLNSRLKAENEKLQAELAAERQNKENKRKAVGSAKTDGANAKYDDFLAGFNA